MLENVRNQIFISYCHQDEYWFKVFYRHLKPYIKTYKLNVWSDKEIREGEKWKEAIDSALSECSVAVLLVSPRFLASDFIFDHELPSILNTAKEGGLHIFWIAVMPSAYDITEIADYQCANNPEKTLIQCDKAEVDTELNKICKKIADIAKTKE